MKLVLFDLDGTLINAGLCGVYSLNKAVEILYGVKPACNAGPLVGNTDLRNFKYIHKEIFKKNPAPAKFAAIKKKYLELLNVEVAALIKNKKYKPLRGLERFLKTLQKYKDIKLALATGNFEKAAEIKLTPLGLDKYFPAGGFGDNAAERVSMLKLAVKNSEKFFKTQFKGCDVFVIGDTHIDVAAAKELGFHSAVVTEAGLGSAQKLLRAAAELETKDFTDIDLWLMWLGVKSDPKGVEKGSYIMPANAIEHVFFSRTGIDEQRLKMFKVKKYSDLESGKLI
ncbi:MAG: HAD hydrolase-like protein [Elusimicrobiota bacterium]|jgi:phosphoglycolate phosphatase-like HAD superfamily hydrolase|nr:HAD hydrolase-like protein [Elusimicrobiota bacterium]